MNAQQLRNSILQEAIQGRLVPQNPTDEPASVLLQRIRKEKERLVKEGKLKKKDLESKPIENDEIPFEIPKGWEWVRLKDISESILYGVSESAKVNGRYKLLRITDIQNNDVEWKRVPFTDFDEIKAKNYFLQKNDILFARTGGTVGKSYLVDDCPEDSIYASYLIRVRLIISVYSRYIKSFFESPAYWSQITDNLSGTGQPNCNGEKLSNLLIPLPPLAEQHRIVAKIEELLPLVEQYGKAQAELDELNSALPDKLKKSVLQEAIQGRLVPQDANDEPASELLKRIRKEKEQLVKEGKLKKKDLDCKPIENDEIPFEIPKGWEWVRLGEIGFFVRGNGIKRAETFPKGCPCVRYGEMYTTYKIKFSQVKSFTTKDIFEKCQKVKSGDILMALTGENKWDIALAATYQGNEDIAIGGDLCKFTPFFANSLFLVYMINSHLCIDYKRKTATGDIIVHISADKLSNMLIPLPPLSEQHRIVVKIEELFEKIDGLKG